jgi:hypothetical protein
MSIVRTLAYRLSPQGQRTAFLNGQAAGIEQAVDFSLLGKSLARTLDVLGIDAAGALKWPGPLPRVGEITESACAEIERGVPWTHQRVDFLVEWEAFEADFVADHVLNKDEARALYLERLEALATARANYESVAAEVERRRGVARLANEAAKAEAVAEADRRAAKARVAKAAKTRSREAAAEAEKDAQAAAAADDRAAWIATWGSARLQAAEAHGYACEGILQDEVGARTAGILRGAGLLFEDSRHGGAREVHNPSWEGLTLLQNVEALRGTVLQADGVSVAMVVGARLYSVEAEDDESRWEEIAVDLQAAGRGVTLWIGVPGTVKQLG